MTVSGSTKVSVLGLGQMGAPIAARLIDAGHDVAVWNRTPAASDPLVGLGAVALARPADAWAHGDVVVLMLADDAAVRAVLGGPDGLLSGRGRDGRTVVEMSTISVDGSAEYAALAAAAGVAFLRAPVTGNPSVVVAGRLGIIVSGPRAAYDALQDLLRAIGPRLFYVGPGDEARVVKLGLNLMIGGTCQLLAESLVLAERGGIDRATMLEVVNGSAIGSPFAQYKTDALIADDYTATFSAVGLQKDLGLALACADSEAVSLPVTALVQALVGDAIDRGMGGLDMMALLPRLEQASDPRP